MTDNRDLQIAELKAINERLATRIATITTGLNDQLRTEIRRQKADAWTEGFVAAKFGDEVRPNPYSRYPDDCRQTEVGELADELEEEQ